jgi:hypothetical protein
MNLPSQLAQESTSHEPAGGADTRLHGRWLLLARVIWGAMVVLVLTLFVVSIPSYYATLLNEIPHDFPRQLEALGLSADFVSTYVVALYIAFACCCLAVAGLLFWHKSDDRMAFFASFTLVAFVITFSQTVSSLPQAWQLPVQFVGFLGAVCIDLLFYLFPTGRFVPRWTRWISVGVIVFWGAHAFFPSSPSGSVARFLVLEIVTIIGFIGFIGTMVVAQVYRYRKVSSPLQRQQTKWVVFGTTVALLGYTVVDLPYGLLASHFPPNLLSELIVKTALNCFVLLIPLSLGFAILHSRLWDIDIIINRTLVYGALTGALALIYVSLVIGVHSLAHRLTGQVLDSPLVIVGSTLLIAALFQPLRHRIQNTIDRRFYRRKYDAVRTLEAFSADLRNEVDLNTLTEHLIAVVQETMQPTHISLWLRNPETSDRRNTRLLPPIDEESVER